MSTKPTVETVHQDGIGFSIYREAPSWDGRKTASIGQFACKEPEAGARALADAIAALKTEGFQAVIGPMDGDTWHSYRAVVESDGSAPFLMEPVSGPHDLAVFSAAGLEPIAQYLSTKVKTADAIGDTVPPVEGISLHNWDGKSPEAFFGEVYDFSVAGFARNAFYKPITREQFLSLYTPYAEYFKCELIFFARRADGSLAGFVFGLPDYGQGPDTRTAILKTYASAVPGAGHMLADAFHRSALELGFDTTIHALIHESNSSRKRSNLHGAHEFRRYALLGLTL
ncbi:MAG: hypothetical protein AAGA00_06055 [Pseudomonadota bacterium]